MKSNFRPALWLLAAAFAVILCASHGASAASPTPADEHGYGNDRNNDLARNPNYQDGFREGQEDRQHHRNSQYHRQFGNDFDRRAYEAGYNQGYQTDRDRDDRDRDDHRRGDDSYRNPGYRMGFQDGTVDGRGDRAAGRRFRYGKGYKHPDRGYVSTYGDKRDYEAQYREAYEKAYRQGYSGHDDDHGR